MTPMGGAAAALLGKSPLVTTIHALIQFNVLGYDSSLKPCNSSERECLPETRERHHRSVRSDEDEVVQRLGGNPSKIHVVNYGVDHERYQPGPASSATTVRFCSSAR
jgi:glycosyltransferase involved in cell wall biosynthesis